MDAEVPETEIGPLAVARELPPAPSRETWRV